MCGCSLYVSRSNVEASTGPTGGSPAKWGSLDRADSGLGERGLLSKGRRSQELGSWLPRPPTRAHRA